ncbi:MAG: hypothetical protein D6715_13095 [Calditrichaeota bacterium]|nr:MAG: hypothetical protein D6715_13095 [Calditrichota bacterium]
MKSLRWILILLFLLSTVLSLWAGESNAGKISGLVFGDYYWIAANHRSDIEDLNGFWVRRIYFTYDKGLSEHLSMRVRFEMNSPGDFSSGNMTPFVKDAYVKWKSGLTEIVGGISPSPTFDLIEHIWGYRAVEKTPVDLQKLGPSREFGIAVKGALSADKKVKYHLMLGNGSGSKSDSNKGKKGMLALSFFPTENVVIQAYGDYNDLPGSNDIYTLQGFAAFRSEAGRIGVQYTYQKRQIDDPEADDLDLNLGSVFAVAKVAPQVNVFARVDRMFDPNPNGPKISYLPFAEAKSTFVVGGLDVAVEKKLHLMPNVEWITYDDVNGVSIDSDVVPRLTFFLKY